MVNPPGPAGAWGPGDDPPLPLIEGDRDPAALAAAFRLLTRVEPLIQR